MSVFIEDYLSLYLYNAKSLRFPIVTGIVPPGPVVTLNFFAFPRTGVSSILTPFSSHVLT